MVFAIKMHDLAMFIPIFFGILKQNQIGLINHACNFWYELFSYVYEGLKNTKVGDVN